MSWSTTMAWDRRKGPMSRLGKWLLNNCDNNLCIDLRMDSPLYADMRQQGFQFARAKAIAIFLGITLVGGS